jgi:hypothetical protein
MGWKGVERRVCLVWDTMVREVKSREFVVAGVVVTQVRRDDKRKRRARARSGIANESRTRRCASVDAVREGALYGFWEGRCVAVG